MTESDADKGAGSTDMSDAEKAAADALAAKKQEIEDAAKAKAGTDADATDDSTGDTGKTDDKTEDDPSGDEDWESRFKGLQPKYQVLQEEKKDWDDMRVTLNGQLSEAETALKTATGEVKDLETSAESAKKGSDELQSTIDEMTKSAERTKLIMSEYPDLATLEAKGLLPQDVVGDDLNTALDEMRKVLNTGAKQILQAQAVGATGDGEHQTGSRTQGDDVNTISELLMVANRENDASEISRLTNLLVEARNKDTVAQSGVGAGDIS